MASERTVSDKQWPEDLGEFMGGDADLEGCCRAMVLAGVAWMDKYDGNIDPKFRLAGGLSRISSDSEAGQSLMQTVQDAQFTRADGNTVRCGDEASSYAYHRMIAELLTYQRLGWDEYVQQVREYTEAQATRQLEEATSRRTSPAPETETVSAPSAPPVARPPTPRR